MSNTKPLSYTSRYLRYMRDNGGDPFMEITELTPRQLRRFRKSRNRIMGANGSGKVTPRQVVTRKAKRRG